MGPAADDEHDPAVDAGDGAPALADDPAAAPVATDGLRRPSPWGITAAALTLLYVVWYVVDLVVLERTPTASGRIHQQFGGFVPRLVFVVVGLGVLFHALDGTRRALGDLFPRWRRHDAVLRAVAAFLTFAVGLPVGLVLVWPAVRAWRGA